MIRETYKGRAIRITKGTGRGEFGGLNAAVNGQPIPFGNGTSQQQALEQLRRDIDRIDREPVNGDRWPGYWYAPGTYEVCDLGHPKTIGGRCRHRSCCQEGADGSPPAEGVVAPEDLA